MGVKQVTDSVYNDDGEASAEEKLEDSESDAESEPETENIEVETEILSSTSSDLPARWNDALARYQSEIRSFPTLSREEEVRLAIILSGKLQIVKKLSEELEVAERDGDTALVAELTDALIKPRDEAIKAAEPLVKANLRLVDKVAKDYRWAKVSLLDLIQEGNVGLMQAVRKFDPTKGVRLASYGTWWIRAYILKYLLNNWHIVKTLTTQQQKLLFFKLRKEKERLKVLGFDPTPKLLAQNLDTTEEQVEKVEKLLQVQDVSLDAPLFDEPGVSLIDTISDDVSFENDLVEEDFRAILMRKVQEIAATLSDKEKAILYDRILADEAQTLQAIAEKFGLSRERIRQIEKRLLRKMKRLLSQEVPELGEIRESYSIH